jgi:hypothetical protein
MCRRGGGKRRFHLYGAAAAWLKGPTTCHKNRLDMLLLTPFCSVFLFSEHITEKGSVKKCVYKTIFVSADPATDVCLLDDVDGQLF